MAESLEQLEATLEQASVLPETHLERLDATLNVASAIRLIEASRAEALAQQALNASEKISYQKGIARSYWVLASAALSKYDYASMLRFAEKAFEVAKKLRDVSLQASALSYIGIALSHHNQLDAALAVVQKSIRLWEKLKNREGQVESRMSLASIYTQMSDYNAASEQLRLSEQLLSPSHENISLYVKTKLFVNIGHNALKMGQRAKALAYFLRALENCQTLPQRFVETATLANLGLIYTEFNNYTAALDYFQRSLLLAEQQLDVQRQISALVNVGSAYCCLENYVDGIYYLTRALRLVEGIGNKPYQSTILGNLAGVYMKLGDAAHANDHYMQALRLHQQSGDKHGEYETLWRLGHLYNHQSRYDEAMQVLTASIALAELISTTQNLHDCHRELAYAYKHLGKLDLCARHLKTFQELEQALQRDFRQSEDKLLSLEKQKVSASTAALSLPDIDAVLEKAMRARQSYPDSALVNQPTVKPSPPILVKTFGEFAVHVAGRVIEKDVWGRKKSRDVFKVLLLHHQRAVPVDELIDTLWGNDATGSNASQVIKNAISFVRKALEPSLKPRDTSQFIHFKDNAYTLNLGDDATIDFIEFKFFIRAAAKEQNRDARATLYAKACEFYIGDFLKEDLYDDWSAYERETLKESYCIALLFLAEKYLMDKNFIDAAQYARLLIDADRLHDRAHEILVISFHQSGNTAEARRAYKHCSELFLKELGTPPTFKLP
jgi:DNA-binding SARP family transcriptional activator